MANDNYERDINLESICASILYKENDETANRAFLDLVKEVVNEQLNMTDYSWLLTTLNFMSINNIQDKVKFVLIESLKLQLLSKFMCESECMKYEILGETEGTTEVLFENEAGILYKRYLPNYDSGFSLPATGSTLILRVEGIAKDSTTTRFEASVEIDSSGYVIRTIMEPTLISATKEPRDFSDIYTDLLSDILQYEDEN